MQQNTPVPSPYMSNNEIPIETNENREGTKGMPKDSPYPKWSLGQNGVIEYSTIPFEPNK